MWPCSFITEAVNTTAASWQDKKKVVPPPHHQNRSLQAPNLHLKLNVNIQVTAVDIVKFVSVHLPTGKHSILTPQTRRLQHEIPGTVVRDFLRRGLGAAQKHSSWDKPSPDNRVRHSVSLSKASQRQLRAFIHHKNTINTVVSPGMMIWGY